MGRWKSVACFRKRGVLHVSSVSVVLDLHRTVSDGHPLSIKISLISWDFLKIIIKTELTASFEKSEISYCCRRKTRRVGYSCHNQVALEAISSHFLLHYESVLSHMCGGGAIIGPVVYVVVRRILTLVLSQFLLYISVHTEIGSFYAFERDTYPSIRHSKNYSNNLS